MRIYLGDLGHYTINLTNNCTPINIGFIAAYAKMVLKDQVEFRLFRNPTHLVEAIKNEPPDILGMSNYIWCQSVSDNMLQYYKEAKSDGCAIWGGPNFPMNELHKAKQYLLDRPYLDFYIPFEGETPFLNIIKAIMGYGPNMKDLKANHQECFDGSFFINDDNLVGNKIGIQVEDINTIPSPYLGGWMDQFLKEGQHPMFETQRGCPYRCTFCHTGLDYYNRGRNFELNRLKEEILYITKTIKDPTKAQLHFTDSNYGMWPQDYDLTVWLKEHYEKTGFPLTINATTGKGRGEHVLKTVMLHPKLMLTNSVQSLDDKVLKAIKRRNLPLEHLKYSQQELNKAGKLSWPEIILGLPEETRESHLDTLRKIIHEIGANIVYQYTLMLLPGTEIYTDEMRKEHNYMVKYRLLPTAYGEYGGKRAFEIEEVSVSTKSLSFQDYLDMREVFFLIHNVYSNAIYTPIINYLIYLEQDIINFLLFVMKERKLQGDKFVNRVIESYMNDTQKELFNSKQDLIDHFSQEDNYKELLQGLQGKNLTHTYRAICLLNSKDLAEFITATFVKYLDQQQVSYEEKMVESINKHILVQAQCQYQFFKERANIPSKDAPLQVELDYDVPNLFRSRISKETHPYLEKEKTTYFYYMRDDGIKYITSFSKDQRVIELALIILRMDQHYIFPLFAKEETIKGKIMEEAYVN